MSKKNDDGFDYPKNIKQIGEIDTNLRIYIEDYALNYLKEYAKQDLEEDKLAVLCGKYENINGQAVLLINSCIKTDESEKEKGLVKFTDKSFEQINSDLEKYFPDDDIVAWVYVQPEFSAYLTPAVSEYHFETFGEQGRILFLYDPSDDSSSFYIEDEGELIATAGYFVYYDKNENMNNYIINNKILRKASDLGKKASVNDKEEKKPKEKSKNLYENVEFEKDVVYASAKTILPDVNSSTNVEYDDSEEYLPKYSHESKRIIQMMGAMSAVLLIITFVMGLALVENREKIAKIESELGNLSNSYSEIASEFAQDGSKAVFAQDGEKTNLEGTKGKIVDADGNEIEGEINKGSETADLTDIITEEYEEKTEAESPEEITTSKPEKEYIKYVIESGDSLYSIARKFYGANADLMVKEILKINNIDDANSIYSGQIILLP